MKRLTRTFISTFLGFALCAQVATPQSPQPQGAKVVSYGEKDVIAVKAKVRFTTLIVLPKQEQILDFTCGDNCLAAVLIWLAA